MNKNDENTSKSKYDDIYDKYMNENEREKEEHNLKGLAKGYSVITSFFFTLIITMVVGVLLGNYIDAKLNTTPLFLLVFIFFSIFASFRNLIKYSK